VSELGGLLELLDAAHARIATLQAEYRAWTRPRGSLELQVERSDEGDTHLAWRDGGPFPQTLVVTRRIWLRRPDALRVEVVRDGQVARVGVRHRTQWWRWDETRGADTSAAPTDVQRGWNIPPMLAPPVLEPIRLLATLRLSPAGTGRRVGRNVECATARPRQLPPRGGGARYELEFDADHGTLLRSVTLDDGYLVSAIEATAVAYDVPVDPERFVFVAPDGSAVRKFPSVA
jgi:hypothetical protein